MYVLDSDSVSLFLRGHPQVVQRATTVHEPCALAVFTVIEILRGRFDFLMKASSGQQLLKAQYWLTTTEAHLALWQPLEVTQEVADQFDALLKLKALRKIGRADLLIACTALANQATLVTRNLQHFRQIPGLALADWTK